MNYEQLKIKFESLPFMESAKMIPPNKFHKYDLHRHICETAKCLMSIESSLDLVVAGYLHDIGKVVLATPQTKGNYSIGQKHAFVGRTIVVNMDPAFFVGLGLDQEKIAHLVGEHEFPLQGVIRLRDQKIDIETYNARLLNLYKKLIGKSASADIIELFWADALAKGGCPDIFELELYYNYFKFQNVSPEHIYANRYTDISKTFRDITEG
jgi:hypothetical protein